MSRMATDSRMEKSVPLGAIRGFSSSAVRRKRPPQLNSTLCALGALGGDNAGTIDSAYGFATENTEIAETTTEVADEKNPCPSGRSVVFLFAGGLPEPSLGALGGDTAGAIDSAYGFATENTESAEMTTEVADGQDLRMEKIRVPPCDPWFLIRSVSTCHPIRGFSSSAVRRKRPPIPDPYRWLEDPDSDETEGLGRGAEQGHVRLPGEDPAARADPAAADRAVELRALRLAAAPRRAVLLHPQRRPAEPERAVRGGRLDGEPRVLLDPNKLSEDGTVALAGWEVSEDGRCWPTAWPHAGSDWREWKVRDVETARTCRTI
jgi:hypothetical protein